ncbi:MAG: DUF3800 domain-containing protein [Alphaproteobacteria bacterium]|nr:DUF3800 domain-containing protein [Alphaproteobacteria bacterium]
MREPFLASLSNLMAGVPITLVAAAIRKVNLTQRYKDPYNPYHIALGLGLERVSAFLRDTGQAGRLTHLIAEARGDREDNDLELEFRRFMDGKGMLGCNVDGTPFEIRFLSKKSNCEGLQLADLCAHPIGRHILNPQQPNQAFDVLRSKFLNPEGGRLEDWGLKVFP